MYMCAMRSLSSLVPSSLPQRPRRWALARRVPTEGGGGGPQLNCSTFFFLPTSRLALGTGTSWVIPHASLARVPDDRIRRR